MPIRKVVVPNTAEQIEKSIVTAILEGEWPRGSILPSERNLAVQLGVTRPTLRETLKQLAKEGWFIIQHGKPTMVADYWQEGGMGVLRTLAKHGDLLSPRMIGHLLEFRARLQPAIAEMAAKNDPQALLDYLREASALADQAQAYVEYDWQLQVTMSELSGNPIFRLIINDFARAFSVLAGFYFAEPKQRQRSRKFYKALERALKDGRPVKNVVQEAMDESAQAWAELTEAMDGSDSG